MIIGTLMVMGDHQGHGPLSPRSPHWIIYHLQHTCGPRRSCQRSKQRPGQRTYGQKFGPVCQRNLAIHESCRIFLTSVQRTRNSMKPWKMHERSWNCKWTFQCRVNCDRPRNSSWGAWRPTTRNSRWTVAKRDIKDHTKKSKNAFACKCEAHESTRKRIPEGPNKDPEVTLPKENSSDESA